ncbi:MAG: signal recognition particle protein, partial [Methylococcaceae bacterium]|nr:signal recognition particle protein [Methylococcaceae bacterium]
LFHPDRLASRILGMGDMLSLIEQVERKVDQKKAERLAKKVKKGQTFNLEDFKDQLQQMQNMGGVGSLVEKLPGMSNLSESVKEKVNDKELSRQVAVINSMTNQERKFPDIIKGNRKKRIAAGCGQDVQDLNKLLKQFKMMQKMMKRFKKGNMANMMRGLQSNMGGMGGGLGG